MWIEQNEQVRAQPRDAISCATLRPRIGRVSTVGCGRGSSSRSASSGRSSVEHDLPAPAVADPLDVPPVLPEPDPVAQLEQRELALEARDAVELRNERERLLGAQAREVAADREVAVDAARPQVSGQLLEPVDVELEDQREADDDRVEALDRAEDLLVRLLDVDHLDVVADRFERGRQVAEAEIALALEPHQDDVP